MSTMLHNGYRIHRHRLPSSGVLGLVPTLRERLRPVYETEYMQTLTTMAVEFIDRHTLGVTDVEIDELARVSRLVSAELEVQQAHNEIKRSGRRNPSMDFGFEVTFLADPADPGWTYALVCTERAALHRCLAKDRRHHTVVILGQHRSPRTCQDGGMG